MWVVAGKVLSACWRSVWVREEDWAGHGRSILLIIKVCLFLCSSNKRRRLGKWGVWVTSNQRGLSGWWCRSGWRRLNVVWGRWEGQEDSSPFFLRLSDWGVNRVRLGTRWKYKGGKWGLQIKGQAEGVFQQDRSRVNIAGSTRKGKEAWQRAFFFHRATGFTFSFSKGGSRNNVG